MCVMFQDFEELNGIEEVAELIRDKEADENLRLVNHYMLMDCFLMLNFIVQCLDGLTELSYDLRLYPRIMVLGGQSLFVTISLS